jgi:hypothetical protein
MNKADLIALKRVEIFEFPKIATMREFFVDLLGKDLILPVVLGKKDYNSETQEEKERTEKYWKIETLNPLTPSSELTVRNYLECMRSIEEENHSSRLHHITPEDFRGSLVYRGLDSFQRCEVGQPILYASIRDAEKVKSPQEFNLTFYLSNMATHSGNPKCGYQAVSKLEPTRLEEACKRFQGPTREHYEILLRPRNSH